MIVDDDNPTCVKMERYLGKWSNDERFRKIDFYCVNASTAERMYPLLAKHYFKT